MSDNSGRLLLATVLAVALPAGCLLWFTPTERHELSLTISPFGKTRLMLAHLMLAVPLAILIARQLPPLGTPIQRVIVATVTTLLVAWFTAPISEQLDAADAGLISRTIMRSLLAILLTLPWILVLVPPDVVSGLQWVSSVVLLMVPPGLLADRLSTIHAEQFEKSAAAGRMLKARESLELLADLGSRRAFGKKTIQELRPLLKRDLQRLEESLTRPLPTTASSEEKYQRVLLCLRLNRTREAEAILDSLPEGSQPPCSCGRQC